VFDGMIIADYKVMSNTNVCKISCIKGMKSELYKDT